MSKIYLQEEEIPEKEDSDEVPADDLPEAAVGMVTPLPEEEQDVHHRKRHHVSISLLNNHNANDLRRNPSG